jgi:hypothetical protein
MHDAGGLRWNSLAVALSSSGAESHLRREVVRSASHLGIDREEVVQAQIACTTPLHPVV